MDRADEIIKQIVASDSFTGKVVHQLARELNEVKFTLEDMMKAMEPMIVSNQSDERSKSYKIIESLINISSFNATTGVSSIHLEVLVAFIASRLSTETCSMQPLLLKVLYSIGRHSALTESSASTIFKSLHANVTFQSQPVSDRYELYKLLGHLLQGHLEAINESLKSDFVLGFIQMIDGERDPRCLLVTFHLFKLVFSCEKVSLGSLTEEAAEVISCYFPIVYNDPSNGTRNISVTRADLAKSLNEALACNASLSQYILPVISEKLHSEREAAKIDAYDAISHVSIVYGASSMKRYSGLIWSCARSDLLKVTPRDDNVSKSAVKALSSLIESLECDQETLELFLEDILLDLTAAISKQDLHLRASATQIILAVTTTSNSFAILVPKVIMKAIESLAFMSTEQNESEIVKLIKVLIDSGHKQLTTIDKQIPCQTLIVSLGIDIDDSKGVEMKTRKLQLLVSLLTSPLVFSDEDYHSINLLVKNRIVSDTATQDTLIISLYGKIISGLSSREFCTIDQSLLELMKEDSFSPDTLIGLLQDASFTPASQTDVISLLLSKLDEKYLVILEKALGKVSPCNHTLVLDTLWSLIRLFVHSSLCESKNSSLKSEQFLPTITGITCLLSGDDDALLLSRLAEFAFTPDILIDLVPSDLISCSCKNRKVPDNSALSIILTVIVYVMRGINGNAIDGNVWLDLLDRCYFNTKEYPVDVSLLYDLTFVLANKGNDNIVDQLVTRASDLSVTGETCEFIFKLCHALCLRCHRHSSRFVKNFNETLIQDDEALSQRLLDVYEKLHQRPDEKVYKNVNVNPLHHQRTYVISSLEFSSLPEVKKDVVKKCILRQLPYLPMNVIKSDMDRIGPLLITALTSKINAESREIAVQCLLPLLENDTCRQSILANVSSIIDSLLDLSLNSPKATVRCNCLNCLTKFVTTLQESLLLPYRKNVLSGTKRSLEDTKRIVRYSAYVCQFAWTLVGQPGNSAFVATDMN